MALEAGDALPKELLDLVSNPDGWQVMYFMRTADCPVCRGHVRRLLARAPELRALGVELIVLAPDEQPPEWAHTSDVRWVLGPAAYRAAGFERTFGAVQQSGTLVARAGRVASVRRATLPFQAFDERALMTLLTHEPPRAAELTQAS